MTFAGKASSFGPSLFLALGAIMLVCGGGVTWAAAQSRSTSASTKRFMDCTLASASATDCNMQGYFVRIGVWAVPGLLLGIVLLLSTPLYCLGKYCCNCCGGKEMTPHYCVPNMLYPSKYSRGDLMRSRVYVVFGCIICFGAMGWGYSATIPLTGNLRGLMGGLKAIPDVVRTRIADLDSALNVTVYSAATNSEQVQSLLPAKAKVDAANVTKPLEDQIDQLNGLLQSFVDYMAPAYFVIFAVLAGACTVAVACVIATQRRYLPMASLWFLMLFGFIAWTAHGATSLLAIGMGDLGVEATGAGKGQTNVLPALFGCSASSFTAIASQLTAASTEQSVAACNKMASTYCWNPAATIEANVGQLKVFDCPTRSCQGVSFEQLAVEMSSSYQINAAVAVHPQAASIGARCATLPNCTIEACAADCTVAGSSSLSDLGKGTKEVWTTILAAARVTEVIDRELADPSATCDHLLALLVAPFVASLTAIADNLMILRQALGVAAIGALFGMFGAGTGAKRFVPLENAGQILDETRPKGTGVDVKVNLGIAANT